MVNGEVTNKNFRFLKYILWLIILCFSGQASLLFSQVDKEFWFVVPELSHRGNTGGTPGTLRIATMELPATVTISMPANPYNAATNPNGFQDIIIDIAGNSTAAVDLSHLIDVGTNTLNNRLENKPLTPEGINNFGLHITATNMITAYWEISYALGSDLWTLKGSNGLGTLFYTPFQTQYNNWSFVPYSYSAIDIVATLDNTRVTITLPPGKAASYGSELRNIPAGGTYIVVLNKGQTFSVFPENYSVLAGDRLAGTRIEADKKISVVVKDDAINTGSGSQDVAGDQLVPVSIIGDNYIVPEVWNPTDVYVLATEDNTPIYAYDKQGVPIGASPYMTLNRGEQGRIFIPNGSEFAHITSRLNPSDPFKPFYTYQMGIANKSRAGAIIPAIGCTGNTQVAFTRAFKDNKFNFFIIVEKENVDKFFIVHEGEEVPLDQIIKPLNFTEIAGTGWMALYSNTINSNALKVGQHLIKNTGGIFHLGILNGFPSATAVGRIYYGYYSDFGGLNVGANVAGTNSYVVRACYGDPVQLYAYGGTNYQWTPDTYLDDATSNMPTAINLPPGPHNYQVDVSGACASGTVDLTILVSTPVDAFFSTDVLSGCSPLNLVITDQSTGNFSWQYDLGDGSPLIKYSIDSVSLYPPGYLGPPDLPDPFPVLHTYTNTTDEPIEYTITLLVKNASGCADIHTKTIVVYPEIQSDFSVVNDHDRGCEPLVVDFQNNSTGNTDTWLWDFGDGGSSIEENPQHVFRNLFGPDSLQFETRLVAISPYYCRDTSYHTITVMPYIEANFAFDTVAACTPHEVVISDQSFGADFYFWDFGDGSHSTTKEPKISKTYINNSPDPVTYTIKLRVENEEGCSDSISRNVTIYPEIDASFSASPGIACSPFEVTFENRSEGAAVFFWDFGDGATSTEIQPVHLYDRNLTSNDTVYTVVLTAISTEFCIDRDTMEIWVRPYIEAAFSVDDVVGCSPFTINISNQSMGVDIYSWDFGDGLPGSNANMDFFDYTYHNNGATTAVYPLQLVVRNVQGCLDTMIRNITVHPEITSNFSTDGLEGCHPLTIAFTNLSENAETYFWEFGDGSSSLSFSPVHTFNNFGSNDTSYNVTLTTATADGECVKTISWPVVVYPNVEAEFTFSESLDCTPFEVTFENLSIGGDNFTWIFGDGDTLRTAGTGPVSHSFVNPDFHNLASYSVSLIVENTSGCADTITKEVRVYPDIQANFEASTIEGCHPLNVKFTNFSPGAGYYTWDFGDGSYSDITSPSYIFTNTGTIDSVYRVLLTAVAPNNVCRDTMSLLITVHPYVQAGFTIPDNLGCNPFDVLIENSSVNASIYRWNFGDGFLEERNNKDPFTHTFNNDNFDTQKEYEIILEAENYAGCTSEIRRTVIVEPDIEARFAPSQLEGCHPLEVNFVNLSKGADYYHWNFGNGTTSSNDHPTQVFTNIGTSDSTYTIWLYSFASNHVCRDSFSLNIIVHPYIHAEFTTQDFIHCSPSNVQLTNASIGGNTFYWEFGDGGNYTNVDTEPVYHVFSNPDFNNNGIFQVRLTAENYAGCTSQFTKSIEVYPAIQAAFSADVYEGCHPLDVNFDNTSQGGYTYVWDFGEGNTSEEDSPDHSFTNFTDEPVTRTVRMISTSRFNCIDETSAQIIIHPKPKARFETDKVIACTPFEVPFINTSLNADSYLWNFGDGEVYSTASKEEVNHTYTNATGDISDYQLVLTATSDYGCVDTTHQKIYVYPATIAEFSSNQEGCSPMAAYFVNESVRGETFLWEFGDGTVSSLKDPTNIYFNFTGVDQVYKTSLTSTSKYGCVDKKTDSVFVYAQPIAEFIPTPTHQNYPSTTVSLSNQTSIGDWNYRWNLDDGTVTRAENPAPHSYATWGEYNIRLYVSSAHCSDSVSHTIRIFAAPPIAAFYELTPGCEPHTVQFTNNSEYGASYLWEFDDGSTSTAFSPIHTYEKHGIYNVKLTVTGEGGRDYAYQQVEVYRNPEVDFRVAPELVMLPYQEMHTFNLSKYGETYLWDFGDGTTSTENNPIHLYDKIGTYDISLEVWTEYGCTGRLVKPGVVEVVGAGLIKFPNAFRPDRTGPNGGQYSLNEPEKNNIFHPYWEGVDQYRLDIYSRWGELLFTSFDVNIGWDGYVEGVKARQGVYVYKCKGTFINGEVFNLVGDVTLLH